MINDLFKFDGFKIPVKQDLYRGLTIRAMGIHSKIYTYLFNGLGWF